MKLLNIYLFQVMNLNQSNGSPVKVGNDLFDIKRFIKLTLLTDVSLTDFHVASNAVAIRDKGSLLLVFCRVSVFEK